MSERSEQRRLRRSRQPSVQQSQGHGDPLYLPVRLTNRMAFSEDARAERREELRARDQSNAVYIKGLRARIEKEQADG